MPLKRTDFASAPSGVTRNNAAGRGWGSGWPHCQSRSWVKVSKGGCSVIVHRDVAELVAALFALTEKLGYDIKPGQTWGAACRPIRGTNYPSNHSWGLAVDLNSLANPMSTTFRTDIPPAVVAAWWSCGWYWGGWYANRPDTMHFEYIRRPRDVGRDLAHAMALLEGVGEKPQPRWRPAVNAVPGERALSQWDRGDDVALIQRFLGINDDGRFGASTLVAVRQYQRMRKLKPDGVVGRATWTPILKALKLKAPKSWQTP